MTCFSKPKDVFQKCFDNLRSGGYLELQDPMFPVLYENPAGKEGEFARWNQLNMQAAETAGRPWTNVAKYAQMLKDIGFVDVVETKLHLPCGDWHENPRKKFIGDIGRENWIRGLDAITFKSLQRLAWSEDECKTLIRKVEAELVSRNAELKPYNEVLVVYGRKP